MILTLYKCKIDAIKNKAEKANEIKDLKGSYTIEKGNPRLCGFAYAGKVGVTDIYFVGSLWGIS